MPIPLPSWPRGLREDLAAAYVGLSVTTVRARRAAGDFPEPVHLTPGRQVYLREQLDDWLDRKAGAGTALAGGVSPWDDA